MGQMKRLQQFNDEFQHFMDSWNSFYQAVIHENPDQMTLDDYAIPDEEANPQPVSFNALQKLCVQKSRDGHTDEIRKLIQTFGVDKLSVIKPEDYPKLWQEVDQLGK